MVQPLAFRSPGFSGRFKGLSFLLWEEKNILQRNCFIRYCLLLCQLTFVRDWYFADLLSLFS